MKLSEIASATGATLEGDDVEIARVSSFANADAKCIVFAEDESSLLKAEACAAGAVIAGVSAQKKDKPVLRSENPKLAFARAARVLQKRAVASGVHPAAFVDATAELGQGVEVGPFAVIAAAAKIGSGTMIGAHAVIAPGVVVGKDCVLHAKVAVYPGTTIGDRVVVHAGAVLGSDGFGFVRDEQTGVYEKFPQIGTLVIEDDVEIGANTTIDRGALEETRIGRGTKLDNLVHVGHNVQIGEDVVIAAQTGISGSVVIERNTVIAGQVGIADHVRIEEGAILGAQCGVPTGKVIRGKGVLFWGTPARPIKEYLKQLAVLAKMAKVR
ncbi:MAG: UDP-3-O-(3-hydroxymyristoyl)glucosamine N-acyltransferase [Acidobacteriales bacterium]|nr:UDP-3-O-(3-hydroxymyristoyl)glucosamine N-acyltransferase [Terriglobales bacterium]